MIEAVDAWLEGLMHGAPLLIALAIAVALGLRHATDPDHLVAVTSLVAADDGDLRAAVRLGAWWGVGHAAILLAIGLPLIAMKEELPEWLQTGAETAVGLVIIVLAVRVLVKWWRGNSDSPHPPQPLRTPQQAVGIGILHGLAGTGAVVLLLIAALPTRAEAAAALALFAPMSVVSMSLCTCAFAWVLKRPALEPLYRAVLLPAFGVLALAFGLWYAGLTP